MGWEFGGWLAGFLENKANISPGKLPLADIDIELGWFILSRVGVGGWLAGFLENKANLSPAKLPLADIDIDNSGQLGVT